MGPVLEVDEFTVSSGVLASTLLIRHLNLKRLRSLVTVCNRLAGGDLSTTITHQSHGIVGAMELALDQLSVILRTISADTRSDIQDLRGSIQEIAARNHELSERTENQASSLVETAAAAEEINGTAQHAAASDTRQTQVVHAGTTLSLLRLQATDPTLAEQDTMALFHFQIDRSLGAKPQTVQTHGKAKQQQILLIWRWNYAVTTRPPAQSKALPLSQRLQHMASGK